MPTLDWIGKRAVLNHHREVPLHLLYTNLGLSAGDPDAGNLLVQGDNLVALKALLPHYAGQVKCVYIDPPYNTGNEAWVYNDAVNSPDMRDWLGEVVGGEAEDLSRHDKWLCMMYPRLQLLRQLMREDGVILISIDDNEVNSLRLLMDEVFGRACWMGTFIWKRRQTTDSRTLNGISGDTEYVLCYSRRRGARFKGASKDLTKYANPDDDPRGPWMSDNLTGLANASERPNLHYELLDPASGKSYQPHPSRGWIYGRDRMMQLISEGRILWPRSARGRPRLKRFVTDMRTETTGFSTLLNAPANVAGTKELSGILGPKTFPFPKPTELIRHLLQQLTSGDDLILDSFAGTGTTGHATLKLNAADGGQRRFILVEMDTGVATGVTSDRLRKAIEGYQRLDTDLRDPVPGLGGGFRFCTLGDPLIEPSGAVRRDVDFDDMAALVFLVATGSPLPSSKAETGVLVGVHQGTAVYLLYDGVLRDRGVTTPNVLTAELLASLPPHEGPKIIFGEGCRLGDQRLAHEGVTFRQIPYDLQVL